jgi:hypothetical protein
VEHARRFTVIRDLAAAQGVKDPSNSGPVTSTRTQPVAEASRPTTIRNVPTAALPSGTAIQRTYKDGKLQSNVR